ncbi:MAG: arginine--tRNA ligase [Patescibacteria group bacterium]
MSVQQSYNTIKETLANVGSSFGLDLTAQDIKLEHPTNPEFGDLSSNIALTHWKDAKKTSGEAFSNPREFAETLKSELAKKSVSADNVAGPGFLNFKIPQQELFEQLQLIVDKKADVVEKTNQGKKAIVEFSSPNIAKPFTIGHLRSTIIGSAVANLLEATGFTVMRDNHLGDWGTQFGKLIYAIKEWGDIDTISTSDRPVKELVALYVKFHEEAEKNPAIEDDARSWFKKLEDGDVEARSLWQQCIDWSWIEFEKIYAQLDVTFDQEFDDGRGLGESFFENKMQPIIDELKTKNLLQESKDAQLIFFQDDKYPPLMIIKKDGATLYATRDLATDKYRIDQYGKDILIVNEVGIEQSLYFQQIFETEKLLGWIKDGQRVHVKHGLYRFKDVKMSTRKGNVIWLEDVLKEAKDKAKEMSTQNQDEMTTQIVGIGALKWNDLRRRSELDIVFDWSEILNMEGNSGPYIQYSYARCKSVLRKAVDVDFNDFQVSDLTNEELAVLRLLYQFDEVVQHAASEFSPHFVCTYLFELAQTYNSFYNAVQIIKADNENEKKFRLQLTKATSLILQKGLDLLGIKTVEQM